MGDVARERDALLKLTLMPGLGPVLIGRAVEKIGSAEKVLNATRAQLLRVRGIGAEKAEAHMRARAGVDAIAERECAHANRIGAHIVCVFDDAYPPLLRELFDAPPILYVRGALSAEVDRFAVALVGSRNCTAYGIEQAERFAAALAGAGLPIVSGGARGIDAAAHRGALRANGRTVAVMGSGLGQVYPPEHGPMYDDIVARGGAVISELPMETIPTPKNFPSRNRILSGMSLGVIVVEAGRRSGALITARMAAEEQGREVMAIPGRVDSASSEGTLELIKSGGAAVVTEPGDVVETLEGLARRAHEGAEVGWRKIVADENDGGAETGAGEIEKRLSFSGGANRAGARDGVLNLTVSQRTVLEALAEAKSLDELVRATGLEAGVVRADATILEVRGAIARDGGRFVRRL